MRQTVLFKNSRYAPIPKMYDEGELMVLPACPEFKLNYTHTVTAADTIHGLAKKFYGDSKFQWVILIANEFSFPVKLTMGQIIKIPAREEVAKYMIGR